MGPWSNIVHANAAAPSGSGGPSMNPTHSAISVVIGLAFSVPAVAEENQLPTEAFLGSPSDGRVVMDTYGNCVRTSQWNLDRNIVGCGKAKPAQIGRASCRERV